MTFRLPIKTAADVLLGGGIIAYPADGVFGLGCLPDETPAIKRILRIKQRDPAKGIILIAAAPTQLEHWVANADLKVISEPGPSYHVTWIVCPGPRVTPILRGHHDGIAARITANPIAAAICDAVDSPLTSTSANVSRQPVARNQFQLHRRFRSLVDYIVPGDCGPGTGPSEIRELESGRVLRPATT